MEDCFDKILAIYNNGEGKHYKALIKIMNNFKNHSNVILVRNVENSDYVDNIGKSIEDLSEIEKILASKLLIAEFNN